MPDDTTQPSTEAQRRAERLGYVAPCRCAMAHEESGHRHECIAGQGHTGWHRCYCGQWFEHTRDANATPASEGPLAPSTSLGRGSMREARLRPEFAALYRWVQPDVWYLAASLERPSEGGDPTQPRRRQRLPDAHFEFRGGESRPQSARVPGSDRRLTDNDG